MSTQGDNLLPVEASELDDPPALHSRSLVGRPIADRALLPYLSVLHLTDLHLHFGSIAEREAAVRVALDRRSRLPGRLRRSVLLNALSSLQRTAYGDAWHQLEDLVDG